MIRYIKKKVTCFGWFELSLYIITFLLSSYEFFKHFQLLKQQTMFFFPQISHFYSSAI
jgi:hypothetical protein